MNIMRVVSYFKKGSNSYDYLTRKTLKKARILSHVIFLKNIVNIGYNTYA